MIINMTNINIIILLGLATYASCGRNESSDNVNTVCVDELDCLDFKPNPQVLPEDPIRSFTLFTRKNSEDNQGQILQVNSSETITNSNFSPKNPTKFVIPGYITVDNAPWMMTMKNELLKNSDWNVIIVQWNSFDAYDIDARKTKPVGEEVAKLIKHIKHLVGLDLNNVHLIGHSLGAHAAGHAGKYLYGLLGRITGLDPAGLDFEGQSPSKRLYYMDAQFVDVIHTNATTFLGISTSCGHIDFYPNGGKKQPNCAIGPIERDVCDHTRVLELFIESINSHCSFVAHVCDTYEHYQQGVCFSSNVTDINIMGLHVRKPSHPRGTKYFLTTGGNSPYCRDQYKVTFNSAQPLGFALNSPSSGTETKETNLVIVQPFDQGEKTKFYKENNNNNLF